MKPITRKCKLCPNIFETTRDSKLYCSPSCQKRAENGRRFDRQGYKNYYVKKGRKSHPRVCVICRSDFMGQPNSIYCSKKCRKKKPAAVLSRLRRQRLRYKTDPAYRERVKSKSRISIMKRYHSDPTLRIRWTLRKRVRRILKSIDGGFSKLVGCSGKQLKSWLESKFTNRMSWSNYGSYWVVDHKIPLASFDLTIDQQVRMACHFTNLQPLTRLRNASKSSLITDPQFNLLM